MAARFRQKKVARRLVQPGSKAHAAVSAVVMSGTREAVRLVPRDTSNLANSITPDVQVQGTRVRGTISTNVEYAPPVEYGTHSAGEANAPGKVSSAPGGMAPRPFMRPGLQYGIAYARRKGLIR